jgi:exo-beta-1,3-glucanase (GH17 family)
MEPASRDLARELDFVLAHVHPMWNGRPLEDAVDWTRATFARLRAAHPDRAVAIGETGWATRKLDHGEQGRLIRGVAGEEQQAAFCRGIREWSRRERIPVFLFEAFDESWKGGPDAGDVEKHWGLFRADRTPKPAIQSSE